MAATDAMGMNPLHVLCLNSQASVQLMRVVVDAAEPSLLIQKNVMNKTPLQLFLKCGGLIGDDCDEDSIPTLHDLFDRGIQYDDLAILAVLVKEIDLTSRDETTRLMPFMLAAMTPKCRLDVVYGLAINNLDKLI